MYWFAKVAGYLLSPLTLVFLLLAAAGLAGRRGRSRLRNALGGCALLLLWICSTPLLAVSLGDSLERQYAALRPEDTPPADAIVVLGGALAGASPPLRPTFDLGPAADRVWHAAALYRAGKSKAVVVAAGPQPHESGIQVEADAIVEMLNTLGVPSAAIRTDTESRNTRENAANALQLVKELKARRVLLVTSAQHMPRAMLTFRKAWRGAGIDILPAVTDVGVVDASLAWPEALLPNAASLAYVTKALREFTGWAALAIMG